MTKVEAVETSSAITTTNASRLDWVDIAKAMSIMLVVLLHVGTLIEHTGGNLYRLRQFNDFMQPIRMPLFFVASGMFARATVTGDWSRFLSRVIRLLWLFAIWLSLIRIYYWNVLDTPDYPVSGETWSEFFLHFVAPDALWFLWSLSVFFILARIAMSTYPVVALALAAGLSVAVMSDPTILPFDDRVAIPNSAMFFVFFLLPVVAPDFRKWVGGLKLKIFIPLFLVAYIVLVYARTFAQFGGPARFAATCMGVIFLLLLARAIAKVRLPRALFMFLGKYTLQIYVLHFPLHVTLVVLATALAAWSSPVSTYLTALLITLACIAISIGVGIIVPKIGLAWLFALPKPVSRYLDRNRKSAAASRS